MPLYDYACHACKQIREVFHKINEEGPFDCPNCKWPMEKLISAVALKRPDAPWLRDMNGIVNDLERVNEGKEERIETREQMVRKIEEMYAEPHPEPVYEWQKQENKRMANYRTRYKERFK